LLSDFSREQFELLERHRTRLATRLTHGRRPPRSIFLNESDSRRRVRVSVNLQAPGTDPAG
jgi:hypothetical protein